MHRSTFFLTSALAGCEWSASRSCRFIPVERVPAIHWIGDWVGPRVGLNVVEKRKFLTLPGLELRPLGRSARSQSLYRLRYPGSWRILKNIIATNISVTVLFLSENNDKYINRTKKYYHAFEWLKTAFGLVIGFIDHLQIVSKSNYNAIAGLRSLKITVTAAHTVFFVSTSCFLSTDPNNVLCLRPYRLTNIPQLAHCPNWLSGWRLSHTNFLSFSSLIQIQDSLLPCIALQFTPSLIVLVKHLGRDRTENTVPLLLLSCY
jgi:hypothetical protein